MTRLYPIFINMEGFQCLVIGGGKVALRKISGLLKSGAKIKVSAPYICPKIMSLAAEGFLEILNPEHEVLKVDKKDWDMQLYHKLEEKELESTKLCYIATDNNEENKRLALLCKKKGILYNVVDLDIPDAGGFSVPSTRTKGSLELAVCNNGNPSASMAAADRIIESFSDNIVEYFQFTGIIRKKIKEEITDKELRQQIMRKLHSKMQIELCLQDLEKAKAKALQIVYLSKSVPKL